MQLQIMNDVVNIEKKKIAICCQMETCLICMFGDTNHDKARIP